MRIIRPFKVSIHRKNAYLKGGLLPARRLIASIAILSALGTACAQHSPIDSSQRPAPTAHASPSHAHMTLKFTLKALPPLGFGYTFRCFLDQDSQKTAGQEAITLTVVVADKEVLNKLNAIPPGNVVTGRFSHLEDGVPYRHMPITGFVDDKMTSWKLEGID